MAYQTALLPVSLPSTPRPPLPAPVWLSPGMRFDRLTLLRHHLGPHGSNSRGMAFRRNDRAGLMQGYFSTLPSPICPHSIYRCQHAGLRASSSRPTARLASHCPITFRSPASHVLDHPFGGRTASRWASDEILHIGSTYRRSPLLSFRSTAILDSCQSRCSSLALY